MKDHKSESDAATVAHAVKRLRNLKIVVLVLAGAILLLGLTSCGGDDAPVTPKDGPLAISDTVETKTGTVTIRSYEVLVTAEGDEVQPRSGFAFAVIEMEGCVDRTGVGVVTIYATDVQLQLTDGSALPPTRSVKEPALQPITNIKAGDCARGWLTYGVPRESQAAFVIYEVVPRPHVAEQQDIVTLRWAIP